MEDSKSWKTNAGSIALAVGGALLAGAQVINDSEYKTWLNLFGTIFVTFGTGLMGYGVADRVSKTSAKAEATMKEIKECPPPPPSATLE
jgi:hypothetical protein